MYRLSSKNHTLYWATPPLYVVKATTSCAPLCLAEYHFQTDVTDLRGSSRDVREAFQSERPSNWMCSMQGRDVAIEKLPPSQKLFVIRIARTPKDGSRFSSLRYHKDDSCGNEFQPILPSIVASEATRDQILQFSLFLFLCTSFISKRVKST